MIPDLLEDVIIENQQAIEMTGIAGNLLSQMMDAYASIIQNNQNIIFKIMTAWTIILSLPTIVASFFGMNITLPFESHPQCFWHCYWNFTVDYGTCDRFLPTDKLVVKENGMIAGKENMD